jgi:hypothetical protein
MRARMPPINAWRALVLPDDAGRSDGTDDVLFTID